MNAILAEEVDKLSAAEKMQLASDLWDSVAMHAATLEVPLEHQQILLERLAAHRANPASSLTLEEFRRRLNEKA